MLLINYYMLKQFSSNKELHVLLKHKTIIKSNTFGSKFSRMKCGHYVSNKYVDLMNAKISF